MHFFIFSHNITCINPTKKIYAYVDTTSSKVAMLASTWHENAMPALNGTLGWRYVWRLYVNKTNKTHFNLRN